MNTAADRNKEIVRYTLIGLTMNIFLSISKFIIGNLFHSYAVVLDGLNSFSDVISAVFILLFARLAAKKADDAHPFGYGRLEYICSILITMIVIAIGVNAIKEAISNIIHPSGDPNYSAVVILIMIFSLCCKYIYGSEAKKKGMELGSESLVMAAEGNLGDVYVAISVLFSIVVYKLSGIVIENYLCIIISLMIIKTGFDMLSEAMTKIIGAPVDPEYRKKIIQMIAMEEGVYNVSSLIIHNYGENNHIASVDIEVDENMKASQITSISRKLKKNAKDMGLVLTSVGVVGVKTDTPEADRIFDMIIEHVRKHKGIKRVQSFTVDFDRRKISFEVVQDHEVVNENENIEALRKEMSELFPDMIVSIRAAINA